MDTYTYTRAFKDQWTPQIATVAIRFDEDISKAKMHRVRLAISVSDPARIGRLTHSKTGKTLAYRGREFGSLKGAGFKANFFDVESGAEYWISGCKKDGLDSLYANVVEIDDDVREEYWEKIRNKPELKAMRSFKCPGKYSK